MSVYIKRKYSYCLFFFSYIICAQNNFYIGLGHISTFAETALVSNESILYQPRNLSNFSLHYGNSFFINKNFKLNTEIFYLNNNLILATNETKRFELHQNIGFSLKPGFFFNKHGFHVGLGLLAVYVFDKDVVFGNQLDRFDDAYFYGLEYNYMLSENLVLNLGYLYAKFESISHYTDYKLNSFSVFSVVLNYQID